MGGMSFRASVMIYVQYFRSRVRYPWTFLLVGSLED